MMSYKHTVCHVLFEMNTLFRDHFGSCTCVFELAITQHLEMFVGCIQVDTDNMFAHLSCT
jgi:hypothetical protein